MFSIRTVHFAGLDVLIIYAKKSSQMVIGLRLGRIVSLCEEMSGHSLDIHFSCDKYTTFKWILMYGQSYFLH